MGQVRVLGFSSLMSSPESGMSRPGSSSGEQALLHGFGYGRWRGSASRQDGSVLAVPFLGEELPDARVKQGCRDIRNHPPCVFPALTCTQKQKSLYTAVAGALQPTAGRHGGERVRGSGAEKELGDRRRGTRLRVCRGLLRDALPVLGSSLPASQSRRDGPISARGGAAASRASDAQPRVSCRNDLRGRSPLE